MFVFDGSRRHPFMGGGDFAKDTRNASAANHNHLPAAAFSQK